MVTLSSQPIIEACRRGLTCFHLLKALQTSNLEFISLLA